MAENSAHILAVASRAATLRVRIDSQGTLVDGLGSRNTCAAPPSCAVRFWLTAGPLALRTGLVWNLLIALPTLYYFCLPCGSVADADDYFAFWVLPASAAVFLVGIPLYIRALLRRRAQKRSFGPEASALLFCLTPLFLTLALLYLAGVARGLKTGYIGDGGTEITWQQQNNFDYKQQQDNFDPEGFVP